MGLAGIDWIDLAEDRDRWGAVLNEVNSGNFLTEDTLASQQGIFSME